MRKKILTVFACLLSVSLMLSIIVLTACKDEAATKWDISNGENSITAEFSDDGNYGFILTVDGSGKMKDFNSPKDAPWYSKSGRVSEIKISDGITYIGDNTFPYCFAAKSVVLPESVTEVGKNAFPASSKVYGYAQKITAGEGTTVYAYSESRPTVEGNFWHEVNGVPTPWPYVVTSAQKILFIGNSYTFYNDMPALFENIANKAGATVTVDSITTGSQSLINWADFTTADGARVESALNSNNYDIVVLQEKSTSPVNDDYGKFVAGAKALANKINETQENCRIFLYETWGSPAYASSYGGTIPEMESRLRAAYETVADKIGANVSYVGKAFTYVYESYPDIQLYKTDEEVISHPSYEGSYLAACVHAATLLGINVEDSTYEGSLDSDTAALLKSVAYGIVFGADMPEISYDMQIAVYSRYAEANMVADLVEAFKEDYAAAGGAVPKIKYSLLGVSNTGVADFGVMVNAGNYDIVFATGNNINSDPAAPGGGVAVKAKKTYNVVGTAYTGTRYISYLTENEIAIAFYDFMETDTAKKILDPAYVPEEIFEITVSFVVDGEPYGTPIVLSSASSAGAKALPSLPEQANLTPMGWAISESAVEGEIYYNGEVTYATFASVAVDGKVTLYARYVGDDVTVITFRIAVFSRYIDENTIVELIAAFKAQYSVDENAVLDIPYDMLGDSATDAAGFGNLVKAGNYNITFGSGNNVDSTGGVTIIAKKSVYVASYSGDRTVAYLTDDEATVAFYEFLDTDAAKKILNPAYIPEGEADEITINFVVDGQPYGEAVVVSNATGAAAKALPEPDADEGFVFAGWALSAEESDESKMYSGNVTYDTFKDIAESGEITLYAIFKEGEKVTYDLRVAVWYDSTAFDPDIANELIEAFEKWCEDENIELGLTRYEQLLDYTKQADFSREAVAQGYNIAIGFKANSFDGATPIKDLYGSDRRIALLIDDEFAHEFYYNFMESDIAKKILDPTYVPEGEGEGEDDENQAIKIVIGVYNTNSYPVTDEQLAAIKAAFIAYAAERSMSVEVEFVQYSGVADIVEDIQQKGNLDYAINVGGNITSTKGATSDTALSADQYVEVDDITASGRKVIQIKSNDVAELFSDFVSQTDTLDSVGKK